MTAPPKRWLWPSSDCRFLRHENYSYHEFRCRPLSPHPDDIICPGSDDELDDDQHRAKRRRIEHLAKSFLQGQSLFIPTATLKGPFGHRESTKPDQYVHHVVGTPLSHTALCPRVNEQRTASHAAAKVKPSDSRVGRRPRARLYVESKAVRPPSVSALEADAGRDVGLSGDLTANDDLGSGQAPSALFERHVPSRRTPSPIQDEQAIMQSFSPDHLLDTPSKAPRSSSYLFKSPSSSGRTIVAEASAFNDGVAEKARSRSKGTAHRSATASYEPSMHDTLSLEPRSEPLDVQSAARSDEDTALMKHCGQGPDSRNTRSSHPQQTDISEEPLSHVPESLPEPRSIVEVQECPPTAHFTPINQKRTRSDARSIGSEPQASARNDNEQQDDTRSLDIEAAAPLALLPEQAQPRKEGNTRESRTDSKYQAIFSASSSPFLMRKKRREPSKAATAGHQDRSAKHGRRLSIASDTEAVLLDERIKQPTVSIDASAKIVIPNPIASFSSGSQETSIAPAIDMSFDKDDLFDMMNLYTNNIIPAQVTPRSKSSLPQKLKKVMRKSGALFEEASQLSTKRTPRRSSPGVLVSSQANAARTIAQQADYNADLPSKQSNKTNIHDDGSAWQGTQAMMHDAQRAFFDTSPLKSQVEDNAQGVTPGSINAKVVPSPAANITPFHEFHAQIDPRGQAEDAETDEPLPSTQALFDALTPISVPTGLGKSNKRASFAPRSNSEEDKAASATPNTAEQQTDNGKEVNELPAQSTTQSATLSGNAVEHADPASRSPTGSPDIIPSQRSKPPLADTDLRPSSSSQSGVPLTDIFKSIGSQRGSQLTRREINTLLSCDSSAAPTSTQSSKSKRKSQNRRASSPQRSSTRYKLRASLSQPDYNLKRSFGALLSQRSHTHSEPGQAFGLDGAARSERPSQSPALPSAVGPVQRDQLITENATCAGAESDESFIDAVFGPVRTHPPALPSALSSNPFATSSAAPIPLASVEEPVTKSMHAHTLDQSRDESGGDSLGNEVSWLQNAQRARGSSFYDVHGDESGDVDVDATISELQRSVLAPWSVESALRGRDTVGG